MAKLSSDQKTYYFRVLLYGGAGSGKATTLVGLKKIFNAKDAVAINKKVLGKDALLTLRLPLPGNKFQGKDILFLIHTFSGQCQDLKNWEVAADGIDGIIYLVDCHKTMRQIVLGTNLFNQLLTKKGMLNLPKLYQYNKRDGALMSVKELQENINLGNIPFFETQANVGKGIKDLFKKVANMLIYHATRKAAMTTKSPQKESREGVEIVDKELEVWDPKAAENFFHDVDKGKKDSPASEINTPEESFFKLDAQESSSIANAEEEARKAAQEEIARKAVEEAARKAEEEEVARKRAEEEVARKRAEEEVARKRAEEEAKKRVEEEVARKRAEEEARKRAEEEVARKRAEEEVARKRAEEEVARKRAIEEARKIAAEEEAIRVAEEIARFADEEESRRQIAMEARKRAEEEAHKAAEEEAIRIAEEIARLSDEEESQRRAKLQSQMMNQTPSESQPNPSPSTANEKPPETI